jgi:hypothetical protein
MPQGICRLCDLEADLQLSHILPGFAFRWKRETSGNGYLRFGSHPNLRAQDGIKRYWMCSGCEGLLGKSEACFSKNLFYPYTESSGGRFRYSRWLLRFCTSISWRVLRFYRDEIGLKDWDAESLTLVDKAEIVWRELLLERRPHPGVLQQHMLPVDRIENTSAKLAPNINRYLMRAIDMDICRGGKAIFVYAKLGRFIFLGFINEPNMTHWRGTKVHATEGVIEPKQYALPSAFLDYINERAINMAAVAAKLSDKQRSKINASFIANADKLVGSDLAEAMLADISMFGDDAFLADGSEASDER